MDISYQILLTIVNLTTEETQRFIKDFTFTLSDLSDAQLYNNHHLIATKAQMFTLFKKEINKYCEDNGITVNSIDIDEFNINSLTERVDVYFEPGDGDDPNQISLEPNIKCYVYPKYDELQTPVLNGIAYDDHSIVWSWEDDGMAHYLTTEAIDINNENEQDKIITQVAIGTNRFVETNLEPNTSYTRRLVAFNSEQTSPFSRAVTIQTAKAPIDQSLEQYEIEKNYDYNTNINERNIIDERLEAFHSGVGDYNDLKVYKQMDEDFYQTFKAYLQLRGLRKQREKHYDTVGFYYKVCLEGEETVEEQKGEVTFDIELYPRENISIKDYMYAVHPITVKAQLECDVLLKKDTVIEDSTVNVKLQEPKWDLVEEEVEPEKRIGAPTMEMPLHVVIMIDVTCSMTDWGSPGWVRAGDTPDGYSLTAFIANDPNHTQGGRNSDALPIIIEKTKKFVNDINKRALEKFGLTDQSTEEEKIILQDLVDQCVHYTVIQFTSGPDENEARAEGRGLVSDNQGGYTTSKSKYATKTIIAYKDYQTCMNHLYIADRDSNGQYNGGIGHPGSDTNRGFLGYGSSGQRTNWGIAYHIAWNIINDHPKGRRITWNSHNNEYVTEDTVTNNQIVILFTDGCPNSYWGYTQLGWTGFCNNNNDLVNIDHTTPYNPNNSDSNNVYNQMKNHMKESYDLLTANARNNNAKIFVTMGIMFNGLSGYVAGPDGQNRDKWQYYPSNWIKDLSYSAGFCDSNYQNYKNTYTNNNNIQQTEVKRIASWTDPKSMQDAYNEALDAISQAQTITYHNPRTGEEVPNQKLNILNGYKFSGWTNTGTSINIPRNANLDYYKWQKITLNFEITIGGQDDAGNVTAITPVIYARNEQRAVIPADSIIKDRNYDSSNSPYIMPAVKVSNTNLQTLIQNAIQQTQAYRDGYTEIARTINNNGNAGDYIIRNVFIKDSYFYADEDPSAVVQNASTLKDGYKGTLNVYADINKMNTDTYSDDMYAVGSNKYLWVSGYSDAIIFEGTRNLSFELNASHAETTDHDIETLVSHDADYSKLLINRKRKNLKYYDVKNEPLANNKIYHVLDLLQKDEDIYLTNINHLNQEGDWEMILPDGTSTSDLSNIIRGYTYPQAETLSNGDKIEARIDKAYQSPILNYRFNYEDPDAYTNYYELLPGSDPDSTYKHVVLVHIYYAKNIYIQDRGSNEGQIYIEQFGDSNIATKSSDFYLNSTKIPNQTYFREDYMDNTIWFKAKPMYETRAYYDEKPNANMDSLYGNVNGRYKDDNIHGKEDLRVATPQFNIPTTVDASNIQIYIMITEFTPEDALVSYKWDNPSNIKDSITQVNGDFVTFSSDTITYKDVQYTDLIQTVTSPAMELLNSKTTAQTFQITKPITKYTYEKFFTEMFSDNSDVMILNYPKEVKFDENDKAEVGMECKGVVNATTKWSPRIHNGYYYLNQHEYYAYSEFDVEADFEEYNERNYETINGYLTVDLELIHRAGPPESYNIYKVTRSELIQNEKEFVWLREKGLTLKPAIDGIYYKEYENKSYISPVIMFPNILTAAGQLTVDYYYEDQFNETEITGVDDLEMRVRSYDIDLGAWTEWVDFTNGSIPDCKKSSAYQVLVSMNASTINQELILEDYLCCYLDWKEDGDLYESTNLVAITDHLQAGPFESEGIYNSKILDYGCQSIIKLDMFQSNISEKSYLYIAVSDTEEKLTLENIEWQKVEDDVINIQTPRYLRYRIVIPYGEKIYWLHKYVKTSQTYATLPIIKSVTMSGTYAPTDQYNSFQEIKSFEIVTDGVAHRIFPSVYDIFSQDIIEKGFGDDEIHTVSITSTAHNINIEYNSAIENEFPTLSALRTPIYATADVQTKTSTKHTPYIYADLDPVKEKDIIAITKGTPQQYSPITVEDVDGNLYTEIFDVDTQTLQKTEEYTIETEDDRHYIKIARNDYDLKTLTIQLNDEPFNAYSISNNLIIFNNLLEINDILKIKYNIINSFYTEIDYDNDKTQITVYSDYDKEEAKKHELDNVKPIIENTDYNKCYLNQIFANGTKYTVLNGVFYSDNYWKYDSDIDAIYYSRHYDGFSMIVNELLPVTSYVLNTRVYSTDYDNGIVGLVIGYIKNAVGEIHSLSYLVSLKPLERFNNNNIALVMDCGTLDETVLASKTLTCPITRWSDIPNGIRIYVQKHNNNVTGKISLWDDTETWSENSTITYDLSSDTNAIIFNDTVYYGFCTSSQQDVYFIEPEFVGRIDRSLTVKEQVKKLRHRYKVYFETSKVNNKFIADNLSMNPVYRTDYKGFIFLTDEHNEPYELKIHRNPEYIQAGGYDKIDITIECLDYEGNPVISKEIGIDCKYGILIFDDTESKHYTDINGVVHLVYESAPSACIDTLTARTLTSDRQKIISDSVRIINE